MLLSQFTKKFGSNLTNASVSTFLLANAFVWYLSAFKFLQDTASSKGLTNDSLIFVVGLNFVVFAFSAFIGVFLIDRFKKRTTLIKYWLFAGIFVSFLFSIVDLADFASLMVLSGVIGAYFGLGMPTFAGFFAACTEPKNRAKFGGIAILLIVLAFPTITLVGVSEAYLTSSILAIWLLLGLMFLTYFKLPDKMAESKDHISYRSVFSNKTFLLYIIPWLMFSLVNDLAAQTIANYFSGFPQYFSGNYNYIVIENVLAGGCAVAFGLLADKKGRKRLALIGFALLGVGYAALGLFNGDYLVAWFYVCTDGIAWGAFTMLFITTIWGDIAQEKNSEKYYVLGVLPYLCSTFAGAAIGTYLSQILASEGTVFSFASFFLFAATLPLFYAPETLSDKIIRNRDLNNYVSKALEKVKKETAKNQKNPQKTETQENETAEEKTEDLSPQDIEARKLAEKYY
jgi:MFS family permease